MSKLVECHIYLYTNYNQTNKGGPLIKINPSSTHLSPNQVHRAPLSKLKQEQEKKQSTIDVKPPTVKTFHPKITAAIPKSDFIPLIKDDNYPEETRNDHKITEQNRNTENLKFVAEETNEVVPPKPLPRASRTNSVCEPNEENNALKPVARPRTNSCVPVVTSVNPNATVAGGYKVSCLEIAVFAVFFCCSALVYVALFSVGFCEL